MHLEEGQIHCYPLLDFLAPQAGGARGSWIQDASLVAATPGSRDVRRLPIKDGKLLKQKDVREACKTHFNFNAMLSVSVFAETEPE